MSTPTTRLALVKPASGDSPAVLRTSIATNADKLDNAALYITGSFGARPSASSVAVSTMYRDTETGCIDVSDGSQWWAVGATSGDVKATAAGGAAPLGWLKCEGAVISRATHARLFDAIGTAFNTGGEAGTDFRLPDFRGRMLVGVDGTAGRLTANDALGQSGGAEKHTLTTGEIPAHSHGTGLGTGSVGAYPAPDLAINPAATEYVTGTTGGGGSHNNMPPYQVVNWLIKV